MQASRPGRFTARPGEAANPEDRPGSFPGNGRFGSTWSFHGDSLRCMSKVFRPCETNPVREQPYIGQPRLPKSNTANAVTGTSFWVGLKELQAFIFVTPMTTPLKSIYPGYDLIIQANAEPSLMAYHLPVELFLFGNVGIRRDVERCALLRQNASTQR